MTKLAEVARSDAGESVQNQEHEKTVEAGNVQIKDASQVPSTSNDPDESSRYLSGWRLVIVHSAMLLS